MSVVSPRGLHSLRATPRPEVAARTRRLPAVVVAACCLAGCNQLLGLDPVARDPDASSTEVDAPEGLDAATCEPLAAADVPGGAAIDAVLARGVAAVARYGSRVFLIGTHDLRANDGSFAAISSPADDSATWTTRSIGGAGNDQLWAVASTGTELLAGGMTRTYQTSGLDEGLLLGIDSMGNLTSRRLRAGVAIQVRAVEVSSDGHWWIGGAAGDTAGLLAKLDATSTTISAISFTIDGGRPLPRRIVAAADDADTALVVGQLGGGTEVGFVARIDASANGTGEHWAVTVPMEVFDAAWFDDRLWVAGIVGADGMLLGFDGHGVLTASWRVPQRPLHRVGLRGMVTWLGGATSDGVFVATLDGDCVTGTEFDGLTPSQPLRARLPLGLDGPAPVLAARRGTTTLAIPLGEDATATCGVPFATVRVPATITATPATFAAAPPLVLTQETVTGVGQAVSVGRQPHTCP